MAQANDTLAKVKASGSLTLGVRESSGALGYTLGDGKYVGFHTEMAENITADIGKQLGTKVQAKYQPVTSQNRIPLVVNGTVDLECGSTTNDLNRQKDAGFRQHHLRGASAHRREGQLWHQRCQGLEWQDPWPPPRAPLRVQPLRQNKRAEGIEFKNIMGKDHADSFLLLETGRADAFVMDGSILAGNISKSKNAKDFKIVGEPLSTEPIACMVRKNDPRLPEGRERFHRPPGQGRHAGQAVDKWFIQPIPPANAGGRLAFVGCDQGCLEPPQQQA